MQAQLSDFHARLDRIKDPKNIAWKDPETGMNIPRKVSRKAIASAHKRVQKVSGMSLLISLMIGMICLMGGRFLRFNVLEMDGATYSADVIFGADLAAGAIAALMIGVFIGLGRFKQIVAQVAGVAVMSVSMHNLIWAFPEEAEQVYGAAFVSEVMSETVPKSIYLRGQIITL